MNKPCDNPDCLAREKRIAELEGERDRWKDAWTEATKLSVETAKERDAALAQVEALRGALKITAHALRVVSYVRDDDEPSLLRCVICGGENGEHDMAECTTGQALNKVAALAGAEGKS